MRKIQANHEENSSGEEPRGICGSGIIDLIAELFLEGWIDIRGKLSPEKSPLIQERDNQLCVEYAPGLYFYQKDIDEFIRTKSAAHTMVEIMLRESGLELRPGRPLLRGRSLWQTRIQRIRHHHRHVSRHGSRPHYQRWKLLTGRSSEASFKPKSPH